jgi:photosystem II stability/assembly factor-like uncharacterized protein
MRIGLLVGTKKGLFIAESDRDRSCWSLRGPYCDAWECNHAIYDAATGTIIATGKSGWFGPAIWRSSDLGATWQHSSEGLTYGDDAPTVEAAWSLASDGTSIYAGVEPAGLFRSDDGGASWQEVAGLRAHPSRPDWQPGGGGLILHTVVTSPNDAGRLMTAISTGGVFASDDAGATWEPRNRGTRVDFSPDPYPEYGQCVHHLEVAADGHTLYQQNHCGMYRSDDDGQSWVDISEGLPSRFGFPVAAHPHDPKSAYVIPLNDSDNGRFMPDAQAAVWRTRDGGCSWEKLTNGLPGNAYFGVLRQAAAVDRLDPAGVYFGTNTGHLYASNDEGESWTEIAGLLPPIYSVECALLES